MAGRKDIGIRTHYILTMMLSIIVLQFHFDIKIIFQFLAQGRLRSKCFIISGPALITGPKLSYVNLNEVMFLLISMEKNGVKNNQKIMHSLIRAFFSRLSSVCLPQLPRIEADDALVAADGGRGQALPCQDLERRRDRLRERLEMVHYLQLFRGSWHQKLYKRSTSAGWSGHFLEVTIVITAIPRSFLNNLQT